MQKRYLKYAAGVSAAVSAALILVNCSGGSVDDQSTPDAISQAQSTITVPGISSTVVFSFDLGAVDPTTHTYYVTDRTNKAITAVNLNTNAVFQFKTVAVAGCNSTNLNPVTDPLTVTPMPGCVNIPTPAGNQVVNNDASGPDGLDIVGNNLYVGDVNALWVLNKTTGAPVPVTPTSLASTAKHAIASSPTGLRADEGCWDPVHNIYAISTPGDAHPFMTFFNTTNNDNPTLIGKVIFDNPIGTKSEGLEACVFDAATGKFFVNNDGNNAVAGSTASRGEMDGIPATSILAMVVGSTVQFTSLAGIVQYPLPDVVGVTGECDPTGIALGPGTDIGVMCRTGTIGRSLNFLILNKTTGAVVATVVGAGGGDQITYDPTSAKWYLADSRSTAARTSCGAGSTGCPLTPKLGVVDGTTHAIVAMIPSGNNSHSVAVDSALGKVISPFTNPSATGGGQLFPNGGINIFKTR